MDMLISPLTWACLALAVAIISLWLHGRSHWLVSASAVVGLLCLSAMTPAVANLLAGRLERQVAVDATCATDSPDVAVVLAGGVTSAPASVEDFGQLSLGTRRRVERAVQWWMATPGRRLVLSGGPIGWDDPPEAGVMEVYARRLGVRPDAMRVELSSLSTWGNARNVAAMVPAVPRRVVLVTSAMHMPRARYAMQHAGFALCEVPADPLAVPFEFPGGLLPQSGALEKTEMAMHELVGQVYYAALGACASPSEGRAQTRTPLCRAIIGKQ